MNPAAVVSSFVSLEQARSTADIQQRRQHLMAARRQKTIRAQRALFDAPMLSIDPTLHIFF